MRPDDRRYSATHEWARPEQGTYVVGVSDFAVEQLGDLTYLKLPPVGRKVRGGESFGEIESVKAVSELYAPVAGTIVEVNAAAPDALELVRQDPFGTGWLLRIRPEAGDGGFGKLLTAQEYGETLETH
ncbi:MAG TPA: glycine cleavage system protein GcvH [Planctomycetota bacterium]|jgi:glycine cleavage system H protein|nr:glycine cleavage system protein GcvH [Planctomycetota bacterium]